MMLAAVLCCAMTTTVFTSCGDDDDPEKVYNYDLTVANNDYDVTMAFDGLHSVIVEVKNAPTWLTVTPQTALNSDGVPMVTLHVQAADDGAERKCTLYLTTAFNEQAVLNVTQAKSSNDDNDGNAYDIAAPNADGVMIYYKFNDDKTALAVTYLDRNGENYSGEVVIPKSVTYEKKTYPVTSIGNGAFWRCYRLTSVKIPDGVTSIGERTFADCYNLTSIEIPNSVTSIGYEAFRYCINLTSVTIPNSVISIGERTFADCNDLASVEIGNGVTSIGRGAFQDCSGLTSVKIPNSVTSIGDNAFLYCSSLIFVEIGDGVETIGRDAFLHTAIETLYMYAATPPTIDRHTFPETYESWITGYNIVLYVPEGSLTAYQEATYWKDFFSILSIPEN